MKNGSLTTNSRRMGMDLTQGPILKTLLVFAAPMVLSSLIQQLYSMVDLVVIGKYVGSIGTVGVSVGGELSDLLTPTAAAFGSAGQIYMAQLVGANDKKNIKSTLSTMFTFMMLMSSVFTLVALMFHKPILSGFLNCPEDAYDQAVAYMEITALGLPFIFGYNAIGSILRAMGESKKPLLFVSIAATVNIFADLFFVAVLKMEAAGTAIATVLSQMGSFVASLIFLYRNRKKIDIDFNLKFFRIDKEPLLIMLKLGLPQLVRTWLVRFSLVYVNACINEYGLVASATNSVGNKLMKLCEIFINAIDSACGAIIGQNLGAKKHDRAAKVVWKTLLCTTVIAMITSALCLLCPKFLFGLFTDEPEVLELGKTYLRIVIVHIFSSSFIGAFQAMVTGCGFVELGFAIGILDGVVCKIGFGKLFAEVFNMGAIGYFWGISTSRILPGLLCFAYFMSGKWRTRKLLGKADRARAIVAGKSGSESKEKADGPNA